MGRRKKAVEPCRSVSDTDLYALLKLFVSVARLNVSTHYRKFPEKDSKDYKALVKLYWHISDLKASPRIFFYAQLKFHKTRFSGFHPLPTYNMMTSPASIDKYNAYLRLTGVLDYETKEITVKELDTFNTNYVAYLMKANKIKTEEDFFKDLFLLSQISKSYLKVHPVFNKLLESGFYQQTYNLAAEDIIGL